MSKNILKKAAKKDKGPGGKNYIPFSPCVPPEFLLVLEEGHLEDPGKKKRGDRAGRTRGNNKQHPSKK